MQTFLPYPSFTQSAQCLDYRRLGKQRLETMQILKSIFTNKGWPNHPATKMWKNHTNALVHYGFFICLEWIRRGYKDTCYQKIGIYYKEGETNESPSWFGDERFHSSHRSNLLRKDSVFYGKYNWIESPDLPYVWPV